jgi:hypothetical protein
MLLEGPCSHITDIFHKPGHAQFWLDVHEGKPVDWSFLKRQGFVGLSDEPVTCKWREVLAQFPNAKVVLTTRDPEKWYDSVKSTTWRGHLAPDFSFRFSRAYLVSLTEVLSSGRPAEPLRRDAQCRVRAPDCHAKRSNPAAGQLQEVFTSFPGSWVLPRLPHISLVRECILSTIWGPRGLFGGRFEDREATIAVFNNHIAAGLHLSHYIRSHSRHPLCATKLLSLALLACGPCPRDIRAAVPPGQLLEFEVKQVCPFFLKLFSQDLSPFGRI